MRNDGEHLTMSKGSPARDSENDTIEFASPDPAAHGRGAAKTKDGIFPEADGGLREAGTFTYAVSDRDGYTDTPEVTVTVRRR